MLHDAGLSIECASDCAVGVLYMRASVVLREGWRSAGYEAFCSAPRGPLECSVRAISRVNRISDVFASGISDVSAEACRSNEFVGGT